MKIQQWVLISTYTLSLRISCRIKEPWQQQQLSNPDIPLTPCIETVNHLLDLLKHENYFLVRYRPLLKLC